VVRGDFNARYKQLSEPIVFASDASGTVVKLGGATAAAQWHEGDRVFATLRANHLTGPTRAEHNAAGLGIPLPGVLTEYRKFPASGLLPVPEYMSHDEASTLPIAGVTAWMALNWDRPLNQPRRGVDTSVLLLGTGGVSVSALQQAKALGLTST
jgi:NADPH:quinone reductase-like Zn-dependent oxidoreductase